MPDLARRHLTRLAAISAATGWTLLGCGASEAPVAVNTVNGTGDISPPTRTVGLWVMLLWFDDPSAGYYPWGQYTRIRPTYGRYYSHKPQWAEYTVEAAENMGVDYLLLDNTNGVFRHDGVFDRAMDAFFNAVRRRNSRIRLAIAVGYEIWEMQDFPLLQAAIRHLADRFADDLYYKVNGKPLVVLYINPSNGVSRLKVGPPVNTTELAGLVTSTDAYGYKNFFNTLSLRYASGGNTWIADVNGVYGWKHEHPQVFNADTMGVMPGWDRSHNELTGSAPTDRENGNYYRSSWEHILTFKPSSVVITSWDDWAEEIAIAPSDSWGTLYSDLTRSFISAYKALPA